MATADYQCHQGDTHGVFSYTVVDSDGNAVSLTGAITLNATYLNAGGAQTSITVDPLPFDVPSGTEITMANADVVTMSAPASQSDTSVFIDSATPSTGPGWVSGSTITIDASVSFVMRSLASTVSALPQTNATATIVDASLGEVSYQFNASDTAFAQKYMGSFVVTFPDATIQSFPVDGFLDIWVEPSILSDNVPLLLSLSEAKQHLRIPANDRSHDDELVSMITGITPVIEALTGPIIVRTYDEWHDGGQVELKVWHRPSTAVGLNPIFNVLAVSEYQGPIEWPLVQVASPDLGQIYSVFVNPRLGTITRRTAGGGVQAFPSMPGSVHVVYQAGQSAIPPNVTECMREYLRLRFSGSQQAGFPAFGSLGQGEGEPTGAPIGFALPGVCRELLSPTRRAPSLA